jgi:hypothetical protein
MTINNHDLLLLIGRPNRKLRGFVPEIKEWHAQGISVRAMHRMLQLRGETADYQSVYREVQKIKETKPSDPRKTPDPVVTSTPVEQAPKRVLNPNAFDEAVAAGAGNPLFKRFNKP